MSIDSILGTPYTSAVTILMRNIQRLLVHYIEQAQIASGDLVVSVWARRNLDAAPWATTPREKADVLLAALPHQATGEPTLREHFVRPGDVLIGAVIPDADEAAVAFAAALMSQGVEDLALVAEAYDREDNFCHVTVRVDGNRYDPTYFTGPESAMAQDRLRNTVVVELTDG